MNTKNLLLASLVGGLISTILVNAPFVNLINLLICAGFWIGPLVAVWLYRRLGEQMTLGQAIGVGMLAGVWHGVFGVLLSLFGLAGAGGLLNEIRPLVSAQDLTNLETSLTGLGGMLFNMLGVVMDVFFGFLGGLIGGAFFRTDRAVIKSGV